MQNIIAVICDCDDTLTDDTTSFLLEKNGLNSKKFWREHKSKFVKKGWDPPLAWMTMILDLIKNGDIEQDSNKKLSDFGKKIKPFKGVPQFIPQLEKIVKKKKYGKAGIKLESYIISSGIEDLIKGTKFEKHFTDIFGSRFSESKSPKKINGIQSIVTFTEKTKFLYAINKGVSGKQLRDDPFLVNKRVKIANRRIPFENMIYLGDGTGDVPCFSAIKHFGGDGISILTKSNITKGYHLAKDRRSTVGPFLPDYTRGSSLRINLDGMVKRIADNILKKS